MKRWKKILLYLFLLILALGVVFYPKIKRVTKVLSLFSPEKIAWNFIHMEDIFPYRLVEKSEFPSILSYRQGYSLPSVFSFQDSVYDISTYIDFSQTQGLLLMKDGDILFEKYYKSYADSLDHISWSTCKSMISCLFGIAVQKGYITSIEDSVDKYVSSLEGSGYEGVSCKDVLQMSSGIKFNEDYADFNSDINKLGRVFGFGSSLDKYVSSLTRIKEPGTFHQYVSMDTQVLGMVIREATGKSISEFMQDELWKPMGAEANGKWLIDNKGMEAAFGGFNACLRDVGRFGKLYADYGFANGKQIVDSSWIDASLSAFETHLLPGDNNLFSSSPFGYGYQWWIPYEDQSFALAMGVYNQYILVDKVNKIVIVKQSANHHYGQNRMLTVRRHVAFLTELRKSLLNE